MPRRLDGRWSLVIAIIIIVVAVAIGLNVHHAINGSDKIISAIQTDNGDSNINWSRYPTVDVELSEALTIT